MTEPQAKATLRRLLRSLTAGSLLHLLAELYRESAVRIRSKDADKIREVAAALFVVGLGVDAVCPRLPNEPP
jgi:hypothetical protein